VKGSDAVEMTKITIYELLHSFLKIQFRN
jgi:hypothetical protein